MSAGPVVQVEDLDVYYGTSQILFGVGLSVREGETMALLGRNGAGKSTAMKAIMGLAPARRGRVTLRGKSVTGMKPYHVARAASVLFPKTARFFRSTRSRTILLSARRRARTARTNGRSGASMTSFRYWSRCATASRAGCPAASSRCWRSPAR
jgi:ABC-type branched-subunit amino acid transport system ATPase component